MWVCSRSCHSNNRLIGKTVVITGANTGIGKETARNLYFRGARVILACRNTEKADAAVDEIKSKPYASNLEQYKGEKGELIVQSLNLKSFKSVRECARRLHKTESKIDILINNAGVMACPFEKTEDGFESQFQTNHLSHFLFTLLLLPKIQNAAPGCRIVCVSSLGHRMGDIHFDDFNLEQSYTPIKAYGQSKLANVLFAKELAQRLKDAHIEGIHTYSLHPGVIQTELGRHLDTLVFRGFRTIYGQLSKVFAKNVEQGTQTTIHCAVDDTAGTQTGLYYKECSVETPSAKARDPKKAEQLWTESLKCVGLPAENNLGDLIKKISVEMSKDST